MSDRNPRALSRIVPAVALVLLLFAALPAPASAPEPSPPPASIAQAQQPLELHWEAPGDVTGDLVVSVTFAVAEPTMCAIKASAAGRDDPSLPVRLWGTTGPGAFFMSSPTPAAHVGVPLDPRLVVDGELWATSFEWEVDVEETRTYTAAAANLEAWPNEVTDGKAFVVHIACGSEVTALGFAGSHEFLALREWGMSGIGAQAGSLLAIQLENEALRTFASDEVLTMLRFGPSEIESGALTHHHPEGPDTYRLDGTPLIIYGAGGPGVHGFSLTRTVVGPASGVLAGAVVGLSAVDSLDDLL